MYGGQENPPDLVQVHMEQEQGQLDGSPGTVIGCHTGQHEGLNVTNPQPGYEYSWAINDRAGHTGIMTSGAQVVQANDPEYAVYQTNLHDPKHATSLDSTHTFNELVLVRTSIATVEAKRAREQAQRDSMLRGSAVEESYLGGADAEQRALEANYGESNYRIMGPEHATSNRAGGIGESAPETSRWAPHLET